VPRSASCAAMADCNCWIRSWGEVMRQFAPPIITRARKAAQGKAVPDNGAFTRIRLPPGHIIVVMMRAANFFLLSGGLSCKSAVARLIAAKIQRLQGGARNRLFWGTA